MSRSGLFDRRGLGLRPLADRPHLLHSLGCRGLKPLAATLPAGPLSLLAAAVSAARLAHRPAALFLGGHPLKLGLSRFLIDLVERRVMTQVATNGSALIHDFELALVGGTSE